MNGSNCILLHQSALVSTTIMVGLCARLAFCASGQGNHETKADSLSVQKMLEPNSVVAVVDGVPIPYKAISVRPMPAESEPNAKAATNATEEEELNRLVARIHDVILNRKLEQLHVTASPEEIEAKVKQTFERSGITPQGVAKMRDQLQALRDALTEWQNNPSAAEDIYKRRLAPLGVSPEQWRLFRTSYDTPEKLKKFVIPKDVEEMKANSRQSARMDVLREKLDEVIVRDVSVSDEEVRKAYQAEYDDKPGGPPFEEVRDAIRTRLLDMKRNQARALWWREQYRKAGIEIKVPAYESVIDRLLKATEPDSSSRVKQDHVRNGTLTCEVQHGPTIASRPVAYSVSYLWGRGPQTPGIHRIGPEAG